MSRTRQINPLEKFSSFPNIKPSSRATFAFFIMICLNKFGFIPILKIFHPTFLNNHPAPFIDKFCTRNMSPKYPDLVFSVFDCRFITPNTRILPTDVVHTLEHFFSTYLREKTGDLIDVSIMGCLTCFLLYFVGDKDIK